MADQQKYHKHIRYKPFDYTNQGSFFVTICTNNKKHLFGYITNGITHLSPIGSLAENQLMKLPERFPQTKVGPHVIMPNHLHFILTIFIDPVVPRIHLGQIIGTFKSLTFQEAKVDYPYRIWQNNYYERIIRNEREYNAIAEYIMTNPINWSADEYHNE